ncbi:MAG: ClbS/DfsB family four-helix bundle protein [Planctomycetota bacterium]
MPRPKTKSELLSASENGYSQLNQMLDALTPSQREATFPFEHRDRNIRDILAHLHEWHLMMLRWYQQGMDGVQPDMPAKGYSWRTTPELNAVIWAKYQNQPLKRVRKKLDTSHKAVLAIVSAHTNIELFTKRHYFWTGTTSLGAYLTSAMPSHYTWAIKLVRRYDRTLQ